MKTHYSLSVLLWAATTTTAFSQPLVEELQRLSFGTLAIAANSTVSSLTIPRTGSNARIEGQFVLIARGTTGRYKFTGFPAYTSLVVSVGTSTLTAGSNGMLEPLMVDNYDYPEVTTDALGEAELSMGARLNTTGTGNSYVDTLYSGTAVLRVDYWQPDIGDYVFNTKTIDLETELSSALTIEQEQELNFGTLFARTSMTGQATLSLMPSGTYTISEPENSRLVSLVRPDLGVFTISGAAPNHSLTIAPQTEEVLLEHTENPGSAPHFILSSLTTLPDGSGTTDSNGILLITLGGTLKTELTTSPMIYPSGRYEGEYRLTVSY